MRHECWSYQLHNEVEDEDLYWLTDEHLSRSMALHYSDSRGIRMSWIKRILGGSKSRGPNPENAAIAKLDRFLTSDIEQKHLMPDRIRLRMDHGEACDIIQGAEGEFGRSYKNPIPVNGPIGEVLYLSSLASNDGNFIFAHRLGAIGDIDVFEIVTADGEQWDILFLDMYHPRKSKITPNGYKFREQATAPIITATNRTIPVFPNQMREAITEFSKSILGVPLVSKEIRLALAERQFRRPKDFKALLDFLPLDGRLTNVPDQRLILASQHVTSQVATIEAVLNNKIGCGVGDPVESAYFALASLTYLYLRYGPKDRNADFADRFQKYVLMDLVGQNVNLDRSIARYRNRYLEYRNLMDAMFPDDGSFSNHDMITAMLHVTEAISGVSARPYMLKVAELSVVLAAIFQDSIEFAKGNLK